MEKFEERDSIVLENEGQKIFAILHQPIGIPVFPTVLVCHGLGGHKTGKYRLYVHLAEMLAKIGIGCLRFDFRGSGDSEGNFHDMTIDSEVSDALKALEYLKTNPRIDTSRVGIFGRSFGGVIAITAASRFQKIKSLALWAPVFSGDQWRDKWNQLQRSELSDEHREKLMRINGMLPSHDFYEQLFNLQIEKELVFLDKLPILHIHGEQDEIVNVSHAEKYQELRRSSQGYSHFLRLGKSDHDFTHPLEQKIALNETVLWFQNTL